MLNIKYQWDCISSENNFNLYLQITFSLVQTVFTNNPFVLKYAICKLKKRFVPTLNL